MRADRLHRFHDRRCDGRERHTLDQDSALSQDYSITVKASAGSLSASQTFMVTVNNVAPAAPTDSDG